ncbi:Caspase-1-A [Takifugu flavidus]|uniref:Caspase-1-A n=1 Tax=Takifugu flavidus TaxID=433684 RepID=A0A5C6PCH2_9TELE|nr:Caspase-1-A [Takifugu flavidus]
MEGQLNSIRPMFVEKVSTQMINQLLDDIFMDGIVSETEKEAITEESNIRSDKARRLIDSCWVCPVVILLHQSPRWKVKGHLQVPHQSMCSGREKQSDKSVYPGTREAINNRVALVITNITFMNQRLNREGAKKDEENMETLLKGLGYEVVKYRNLTGQAIEDAVIDFSKRPKLKDTDSVVVVIMSHGRLGVVAGVSTQSETFEDDHFSLDKIYRHLAQRTVRRCSTNPRSSSSRPAEEVMTLSAHDESGEIIFNDQHPPENPPVSDDANIQEDAIRIEHKEKDFIWLLSCTPDTVSYRALAKGSFLVQVLVDVFKASAERDDLEELFRKVQHRFEDFPIGNRRQMPTRDRCTLTKRFYFYPGLI